MTYDEISRIEDLADSLHEAHKHISMAIGALEGLDEFNEIIDDCMAINETIEEIFEKYDAVIQDDMNEELNRMRQDSYRW